MTSPDGLPSLEEVAAAFPQLEVIECIGRGGMGVVYKARQTKLERIVALKVLPRLAARDPAFRERFTREGRVLARLNHPNIVTVYDFGETGGFFYLLMEYVDGANLRQAMQAGRFSPAQALEIVPKICEALQYAHAEGILHRDIKPENILLDTRGRVKIADFGIAKLVREPGCDRTLTATGAAVGTPQYMAPEQLEHPQEVDHRADIYSLGVVFYEMLTGELPIGRFAPPSARTPVDTRVDAVVLRTLEKDRERRFQSAGEVKTEVEGLAAESGGGTAGAGKTPSAPAASEATTPPKLKEEYRPLILIGLVVALVMMLPQLLPLPGVAIALVGGTFRGGAISALWGVLSLAAGGWLLWAAWTNRRRLLEPLGIAATDPVDLEPSSPWTGPRALQTVGTLVLMAFALVVACQVALLLVALRGFASAFTVPAALALIMGGLLAWRMVRSDRKLSVGAPGRPPGWQRRVGVLFLILGGLAFLPALGRGEENVRYWQLDSLLALTGVALLTRNRSWRRVALVVNAFLAVLGITQMLMVPVLARVGLGTVGSGLGPLGPGAAMGLALIKTMAFVAGLWVLCRRDVRASFGLHAATAGPPVPSPIPAPGSAGPARMSRMAVCSFVLILISLVSLFAVLVLAVFLAPASNVGRPSVLGWTILGLPTLGAAVVGTLLGWMAWSDIRHSLGRLRGKALAIIGALTWPVLMVLAVPLGLGLAGYLTLRVDHLPGSVPLSASDSLDDRPNARLGFGLPAGRVGVFELVTRQAGETVIRSEFSVYVLAPTGGEGEGTLKLAVGSPGLGSPGVTSIEMAIRFGTESAAIVGPVPAGVSTPMGSSSTRVTLPSDGEVTHWFGPEGSEASGLGVRVRIAPHDLKVAEPGIVGTGTNWLDNAKLEGR